MTESPPHQPLSVCTGPYCVSPDHSRLAPSQPCVTAAPSGGGSSSVWSGRGTTPYLPLPRSEAEPALSRGGQISPRQARDPGRGRILASCSHRPASRLFGGGEPIHLHLQVPAHSQRKRESAVRIYSARQTPLRYSEEWKV